MKLKEFMAELREALTMTTRGSLVKAILLVVVLIILAIGLSALVGHFFPSEEEFETEFVPRYKDYAYLAIFVICLVSSLSVLFPVPGTVLWLLLVEILDLNCALAGFVASIGGTLGEISAYYVGYGGRAFIAPEHSKIYQMAERWMKRRGGLAIFLFALVPFLIFDLVGIAAGVLRYPLRKFYLFTWLGRLPRSLIECYIGVGLLDYIL